MIADVRHTILENGLFAPRERVLVAVSGGIDSVVLLDCLVRLQEELAITLGVVHVEHGLRGEESLQDAHFVEKLAGRYELPFFMERFDVIGLAKARGLSEEMAAREVRYAFFAKVAAQFGAQKVVTAHHADDQAETVLMRLLRGTTMRGLAGIPLRREGRGYELVRPLLHVERAEIERYAREQGIIYREDSSNALTAYLRNKIRIRLFPLLEREYNPSVKAALRQIAELAREEEDYLGELAEAALRDTAEREASGRWRVDVKRFAGLAVPLQRRVITLILYYLHGHTRQWEQIHIEHIRSLMLSESPSAETALPGGVIAWREYGILFVGDASQIDLPAVTGDTLSQARLSIALPGPGSLEWQACGLHLQWEVVEGVLARPKDVWEVHFDADVLSGSCIYIRTWATGDTLRPLGLQGTKLVSDVLGEAKVPKRQRGQWPLLCVDDAVVWVVGIRRGQQALVTAQTRRTLVLRAAME